jgi:hypothetical protein
VSISKGYVKEERVSQDDASSFLFFDDDSSSTNTGVLDKVVPDNKSSPLGGRSVLSDSRMVSFILALFINLNLQCV